ncbi:DUF4011 domain-containing protein [Roseiconus lacunae]|uniref:DUF4011 domain-containing protein n=1 Tax=Roseiconus lacunae TaxID=2605694 RepID=UPI001E5888CF|nr:DUF4011 domain-containing protein [Roseiconus lacunae]MCD0461415.1 DUF4011 domain-containing protein [Roseiconus lacunae]
MAATRGVVLADTSTNPQIDLETKLESWRERLLDLGNRNPLINCRFTERSSLIEFDTPSTEVIWCTLAADSEAGASPMRFPWRRDLVPPPADWQEFEDEAPSESNPDTTPDSATTNSTVFRRRKRREWNPPLSQCRESPQLKATDLLVDRTDTALDRKLRKLAGDAQLSMSEQGVHSLYAAFGFLKWYESVDSGEQRISPLVLVPVSLSRETTSAPWELTEAEDDALDNLCLRQRLYQDFKLELPPLPEISDLEEPEARLAFLQAVRDAVSKNDRWVVEDRCAIGRFAFPKIAMWQDLGDHRDAVTGNSTCRILGGDEGDLGPDSFGPIGEVPSSKELDDALVPGEVKTILDCDSSQLEAIAAARKGVSFVLDGPPGTGKSQTIANIIADALSVGRSVLFVSEKIAALEVVKNRLEQRGLGDFCLECHSSKANRRAVLFELERCLDLPAEVYKDTRPKLEELASQRESLNRYARNLHRPREPLGFSPFELFGRISRLKAAGAGSKTRCVIPAEVKANRSAFDSLLRLLDRAGDFADLIRDYENHPWRGCHRTTRSLSLHDDVKHHFSILAERSLQLAEAFDPLTDADLLEHVTLQDLGSKLQACCSAIATPVIPEDWLSNPAQTSAAIIELIRSRAAVEEMRPSLESLAKPAELSLSIESVQQLLDGHQTLCADPNVQGLRVDFSPILSEQRHQIELELSRIGSVHDSALRLREELTQWQATTELELPDKLTLADVQKLGDAAETSVRIGSGRTSWLNKKLQPSIRALAQKAISIASKNEALAKQLSTLLPAEQILTLVERVEYDDQKAEAIKQVADSGIKSIGELDAAASTLTQAIEALAILDQAKRELTCHFNLSQSDWPGDTYPSDEFAVAMEQLQKAGWLLGGLKSHEDRSTLRNLCEEAITDLEDADAIKTGLQDRMSHRAFRQSSEPVIAKGAAFSSLWKRWFGGFGKYRLELADYYNDNVPQGSELLDDIVLLQRFHRRQTDVQSSAAYWSERLPEDFDALEVSHWNRLIEALDALEQIQKAWPELVANLPTSPVLIEDSTLAENASAYVEASQNFLSLQSKLNEHSKELPGQLSGNSKGREQFVRYKEDIEIAAKVWRNCEQVTNRPLQSTEELATLCKALKIFGERTDNLLAGSQRYSDWFPEDLQPTERMSWEAMHDGVHAAELFTSIGVNDRDLSSAWCNTRFRSRNKEWEKATVDLRSAFEELSGCLRAEGLKLDGFAFQSFAQQISDYFSKLSEQVRLIDVVSESLNGTFDPNLEQLSQLADRVRQCRVLNQRVTVCESQLNSRQIDSIVSDDLRTAQWLESATESNRLTPLVKAVASDEQIRLQVQEVAQVGESLVDHEYWNAVEFLKTLFDFNECLAGETSISRLSLEQLSHRCRWWIDQTEALDRWIAFAGWRKDVDEAGMTIHTKELTEQRYEPDQASDVVAMQVYRELFDELAETDREFGEFDIDQHERVRDRFRQLDQWEVQAAATQIRQYQLGRSDRPSSSFVGADSSELGILQKEIAKKRKHKPLRRLFSEIPSVLQRLKPCVMMSPLSVSTFLNCDELRFDLVIFDEASQVFPWDALGAIYRGTQLIVAGDEKQLPPTNFFSRQDSESDDDEEDDIGDYESILSLCKSVGMPNKRLKWHYRSKREPLIAFSNRHFYDGELVTFPSVDDGDGVRFEYVPNGRWVDRKNLPEAERVVEMIVDHVRTHPDKSLGVIALNSTQQRAIEDTLYDLRRERRDIDALFHGSDHFGTADENLFIKNLENVQGDERDFIFLSFGYGFNNAGKFNKNFGPINKQHGERRLNVAVTRARESLTFVASVRSADMDLSGSKSEGAHLLKSYLSYAERGVDTLDFAMQEIAGETDSPFEEEVANALIRRGLEPVSQVGCGGFRIDLALKHPERPGQFCLAVECDGATYHSSHTARDRDRIRQSILENLGWTIIRIWSTDWVRSPDRQVERILQAYEQAIANTTRNLTNDQYLDEELEADKDFEPTIIEKNHGQTDREKLSFNSIDEVPAETIQLATTYVLGQAGAMTMDDLIRQVSRELGFRRTGQKIRSRIESNVLSDIEAMRLKRSGERIALNG